MLDRARPPRPPPKALSVPSALGTDLRHGAARTFPHGGIKSRPPPKAAPKFGGKSLAGNSAKEATARYRARLAAGEKVYGVVADDAVLEYLIATLWLDRALSGDKVEVGKAISRMLADSAKG